MTDHPYLSWFDYAVLGAYLDGQIWQEYSLFFTLPISVFGFLIGNCFGSNYTPPASEDARR